MDEQLLLNGILEGDTRAYKEMFVKFYSPLCEYVSQFISDVEAEELVQDLMLHIWEKRKYLAVETSLKSYLFVAAKNRTFNAIRNEQYRKRVHAILYEKLKEQFEDPDYYMVEELAIRIQSAIKELPEKYKQVFEMSRFGENTNSEIATNLGISIKTVEYRITKSLKILRIKLKDYMVL